MVCNYVDGWIHLSYRGNRYILNPMGSVHHNTSSTYVEDQALLSISSLQQGFQEGVTAPINVSEGDSLEMTQEEINSHILGVAMLQQFSLKAGLEHRQDRDVLHD